MDLDNPTKEQKEQMVREYKIKKARQIHNGRIMAQTIAICYSIGFQIYPMLSGDVFTNLFIFIPFLFINYCFYRVLTGDAPAARRGSIALLAGVVFTAPLLIALVYDDGMFKLVFTVIYIIIVLIGLILYIKSLSIKEYLETRSDKYREYDWDWWIKRLWP